MRIVSIGIALTIVTVALLGICVATPASGPSMIRADGAQGYASYRHMLLADDNGVVAPDGLIRATAQANRMRAAQRAMSNAGGITRQSWTWLGPGNIGGRVRAIAVHPTTTSTLFVGGVDGGIWKSTDSGTNWTPIDDFMANLAVSCLLFQPGAPATLWAGTGEGFYNFDAIQGAGIFRSIDGGTTWTQVSSTATDDFRFVNRLAISSSGTTILAATSTGVFRSLNNGGSWTKVLTPATMSPDVYDVRFLPGAGNTNAVAGGRYDNAYVSTDSGATWALSAGPAVLTSASRVEIGVSVSAPATVYLQIDHFGGEIWRSIDSGATFARMSNKFQLGGQGWYDNAIWVDPTNVNNLILGGVSLSKSTDGGATLTSLGSNLMHSDYHAFVSDPGYNGTSNKRVYIGNDGGVWASDNLSVGAATSLNHNLGITQFFGAGGNTTSGKIVAGAQDNGTLLYSIAGGPQGWTSVYGGDGGNSAADPVDVNYLYGEYTNLRIHRGVNGGVSQSVFIYGDPSGGAVCKDAPYRIDEVCFLNGTGLLANFVAPFLLDPNNANRLLGGALSLWRTNDVKTPIDSTNNGPTWAAIKPPDPGSYNFINAIAVASGNSDIIWVGHNFQALYVTTNGTATSPTWTKVGTGTLPYRPVTSIALDPANTNIAYVSYGSFSANNIWKTTNRGGSWSPATGSGATGLPDAPVYSVVVHPSNSQWLYAGTEVGVFASTDAGATWTLPQDGPSNVSVNQLFWMGKTLLAVTHGRGVFKSTAPISGAPIDFTDDPIQAGVTVIKAIHLTELRQAVDTLRARYSLAPIVWPAIAAGATTIRAVDVTNLRAAIVDVYVAAHRTAPTFSPITANVTGITAVHIAELRAAIGAIY